MAIIFKMKIQKVGGPSKGGPSAKPPTNPRYKIESNLAGG